LKNPLVTVVIPTTSKRSKYLERAVKSVKRQTYRNIELLVINREDLTATEARNLGIKQAKGEYIAFLDDDDEWLPAKTAKQVKLLEKYKNTHLCITWIEDHRFGKPYIDKYPEILDQKQILKLMRLSSTSSYMIRKSILDKSGGFDTNLLSAHEYDLAIRISQFGPIRCIPETLVIQHSSQQQITKDFKKKKQGIKTLYSKHKPLYKKHGIATSTYIKIIGMCTLFDISRLFGSGFYGFIIRNLKR